MHEPSMWTDRSVHQLDVTAQLLNSLCGEWLDFATNR